MRARSWAARSPSTAAGRSELPGLTHGWRLLGDARRLAAHGVLRPFEHNPDVPGAAARIFAIVAGTDTNIDMIVDNGLHQFIQDFIKRNNSISAQIEQEFRFYH